MNLTTKHNRIVAAKVMKNVFIFKDREEQDDTNDEAKVEVVTLLGQLQAEEDEDDAVTGACQGLHSILRTQIIIEMLIMIKRRSQAQPISDKELET